MTKKGPLSKAEQFYIEQKYLELDLGGLCKELDRAKGIVEKHIKSKNLNKPQTKSRLGEQFAYQKGSTVMTQNASEVADSMRGKMNETTKTKGCTVSIRRSSDG